MDQIEYTRSRFAQLLGLDEAALGSLDSKMGRNADKPVLYLPKDLSAYRQKLPRSAATRHTRKQLFLNFKGGTGKTSLSTAYAYRLAEMGNRVLLIDLDSQGHAAKCLGYEPEQFPKTLFEVLIKKVPIKDILIETALREFHLVPSNLTMSTIDLALMPMHAREYKLRQAFEGLSGQYDFIVMDAPPSFGLLNLNALMATNDLIIPVLADFLSFHGLKLLFETIAGLEQDLQLVLDQIFVVINHFNPTTRIARQARDALEKHYADFLLETVVRQCTKFAQASSEGIPISAFDPTSKGAQDIESFISEVRKRTKHLQAKEKSV